MYGGSPFSSIRVGPESIFMGKHHVLYGPLNGNSAGFFPIPVRELVLDAICAPPPRMEVGFGPFFRPPRWPAKANAKTLQGGVFPILKAVGKSMISKILTHLDSSIMFSSFFFGSFTR